jgi:hypothetical protein
MRLGPIAIVARLGHQFATVVSRTACGAFMGWILMARKGVEGTYGRGTGNIPEGAERTVHEGIGLTGLRPSRSLCMSLQHPICGHANAPLSGMLAPKARSCQLVAKLAAGRNGLLQTGGCWVFLAAWRNEKRLADCHRIEDWACTPLNASVCSSAALRRSPRSINASRIRSRP